MWAEMQANWRKFAIESQTTVSELIDSVGGIDNQRLASSAGDQFKLGVILHDGTPPDPATPKSSLGGAYLKLVGALKSGALGSVDRAAQRGAINQALFLVPIGAARVFGY